MFRTSVGPLARWRTTGAGRAWQRRRAAPPGLRAPPYPGRARRPRKLRQGRVPGRRRARRGARGHTTRWRRAGT
ncbi:hypothetical protein M707_25200 [Arthrobacter sp. AK-YN10]|nr:hypothetical protein M707_25200 [Arthrobacter sp. AK-YN10]